MREKKAMNGGKSRSNNVDNDNDSLKDTIRFSNTHSSIEEQKIVHNHAFEDLRETIEEAAGELEGILKEQDEKPAKPKGHSRNVSWTEETEIFDYSTLFPATMLPKGRDARSGSIADSANVTIPLQQLKGAVSNNNSVMDELPGQPQLPTSFRPPPSGKSIDLEDVLKQSPMETEATTYIMRALESRDPTTATTTTRPRSDSALTSTSILSGVPDDALHGSLSNDSMGLASKKSRTDDDDENSSLGSRSAQGGLSLSSSRRGLRSPRKGRHRRIETMEQKLFDLTYTIDEMAKKDTWEVDPEPDARLSPMTAYSPNSPGIHTDIGSADAFQQNASILFNRAKFKMPNQPQVPAREEGGGEVSVSAVSSSSAGTYPAARRWQKLRAALQTGEVLHPKKSDGEEACDASEKGQDEETGGDAASAPPEFEVKDKSPSQSPHPDKRESAMKKEKQWKLFKEFQEFFDPYKLSVRFYIKIMVFYIMIPIIGVAAILFYLAGNPPYGILANNGRPVNGTLMNQDDEVVDADSYSVSWMLLFVARQLITGSLAKATELLLIDFLSIRSKSTVTLLGPWPTLFILQSRGWPFILWMWSIFNYALLFGSGPFHHHWLYFQDAVDLFNRSNPSGNILTSEWNRRILAISVSVGLVVAVKRFWLGLYLGKQTFLQYSDKLALVMSKIILVSQVASLSRDFEKQEHMRRKSGKAIRRLDPADFHDENLDVLLNNMQDDATSAYTGYNSRDVEQINGRVIDSDDRHPLTGSLSSSQRMKIVQLLGAWEEPTIAEQGNEKVTVTALLQFRRAMACLATPFPFSGAFGIADTRERCIESAQEVYDRLMLRSQNPDTLNFEVLALLGVHRDGSLDQEKLKELIRLFRPDRDGSLKMLEFVKSVDLIYRDLRLLRASVANSSKIDLAFENIFNIIFYGIVGTIIVSRLGFDPLALFLSISGVVLGFAFMISSASSKYFEGLLFILVRRPYQIGDGIHVSNVETDTNFHGSAWWTVQDVNLFTTTVIFLYTGERATLSNGSLANSRIINSSMSTQAYLYITLKFPVDVAYDKVKLFHSAIEQFLKNRPREWLSFLDFRALQVDASKGFIEYMIAVQHRHSWYDWGTIMLSKSDLIHFSLELSKKLDIWYKTPPLPVSLSVVGQPASLPINMDAASPGSAVNADAIGSPDLSGLQAMFAPHEKNI